MEMQETRVQSLGLEDPLEEEMATLSSILAWEIPWTEEPGGLQSMGRQRVRQGWAQKHTLSVGMNFSFFAIGLSIENQNCLYLHNA